MMRRRAAQYTYLPIDSMNFFLLLLLYSHTFFFYLKITKCVLSIVRSYTYTHAQDINCVFGLTVVYTYLYNKPVKRSWLLLFFFISFTRDSFHIYIVQWALLYADVSSTIHTKFHYCVRSFGGAVAAARCAKKCVWGAKHGAARPKEMK